MTGLVAVVEHHWLDHSDVIEDDTKARNLPEQDGRKRDPLEEMDDKHSIRKLEREVAELKRSLSQKAKDEENREARPVPRLREESVREWRPPHQDELFREQYIRGRGLEDDRAGPSSYQNCQQLPVQQQMQIHREPEILDQSLPYRERHYRPSHRHHLIQRRRRRHRHSSVPNRSSYEDEFTDETIHAGKVAALAGFVEAMHVSNIGGDWAGPKGMRVGTTMAASFAASHSRGRGPDHNGGQGVAVDVGTGLLVSRLVHGSTRMLGGDERVRRGRRWSYCY